MAAARTRIPTPAPIPALAPVDKPEEPPPLPLSATRVGATPGVLVRVAGSTIVVAACVVTTKEVTVVKPTTPFEVVGKVSVTKEVLVENDTEELDVVMTTGVSLLVVVVVLDSEEVDEVDGELEVVEDVVDEVGVGVVVVVVEEDVVGGGVAKEVVIRSWSKGRISAISRLVDSSE